MLKRKPRKGEILLYETRRGRVQAEVLSFFAEDILNIRLPAGDTQIIWRFHDGLNKLLSHQCEDHWRCDPATAGHRCDAPDRASSCPTCGEEPSEEVRRAANLHAACQECERLGHLSTENGCTRCGLGAVPYCQEHDLDLIEGRCPECAKLEDHEEARAIASQLTP